MHLSKLTNETVDDSVDDDEAMALVVFVVFGVLLLFGLPGGEVAPPNRGEVASWERFRTNSDGSTEEEVVAAPAGSKER
jgi:hypothetical protein